jgi:hypothetical protein
MPVIGPTVQTVYSRYLGRKWQSDVRRLSKDIESLTPEDSMFIIVDEGDIAADVFSQRYPVPLIERDGQYWGPPVNDDAAIQAVELMRKKGAGFIVIAWPAFWWLDYYKGWNKYLRSEYRCIMQNNRVVVFDLRKLKMTQSDRQEFSA